MMRIEQVVAWLVIGASGVATAAQAQEAKRLETNVTLRAVRDDNISRSNPIIAAQRGIEQTDTIYSPALSVDLYQPIGRQAVFLNGSAGYDFYEENDQLNSERILGRGGAVLRAGPCATTLSGTYQRNQTDLRDIVSNAFVENLQTDKGLSAELLCGRPVGFGASLSAGKEWSDNSAVQRKVSDYESERYSLGVVYQRPTFGTATLFASHSETTYENRVTATGSSLDDGFQTDSAGLTYTRRIGARLQGTATVAYTSLDPVVDSIPDFKGATYGLNLTYRPSSRIEGTVSLQRAAKASSRVQTTYSVEKSIRAEASYALGSRLRLSVGGSYADAAYEATSQLPGLVITSEKTKSVFGSARFNVNNRISLALDATQEERDANVHGVDYTDNRLGLSVSASY